MAANDTAATDLRDDLATRAAEGMLGPNPFIGLRPLDIWATLERTLIDAAQHPRLLLEEQVELVTKLIAVLAGCSTLAPAPADRRFQDAQWQDNPFYRACLQGYLAWAGTLDDFVGKLGLDRTNTERARFAISLIVDALAPSNMFFTNPAALKKLQESGGASILKGLQHLFHDVANNHGMPAQVDKHAFQVGGNLALSPGAVVFRNPVLELVQYRPAGETVFARPLMIVPPQINKFYLFDLTPKRSLVEYLVKNEFQVFAISWRNPSPAERDWNLDTYVGALIEAIDTATAIAGTPDINLAGACSGGMTTSALLGHLAARHDRRVNAATMMVMVLDRNEESQLGLFATPEAVAAAKAASRLRGVVRGEEMGRMFAWMRPNDLVWNYWVNNYLLGNAPPAFDVLYWNNDTTRLPAGLHAQLLDISMNNLFRTPGALTVMGTPIDLAQVSCDKYVVAGVTDHITPWQGGYRAMRLFGGATEFVLSSSGHIQSIINPPGNAKARYFVNPEATTDAAAWRAGADAKPGSWWDHWRDWLGARSGHRGPAPARLGDDRHPPLAPAPGVYVLEA